MRCRRGVAWWISPEVAGPALGSLNAARDRLLAHEGLVVVGLDSLERLRSMPDLRGALAAELALPDEPTPLNERGPLSWLHLSDIHFRARRDPVAAAAMDALVRDLADENSGLPPIDLLFVTGDLAWSGRREEYAHAADLLRRVADVWDLDRRRQVFVVPGNHDVAREAAGGFSAGLVVDSLQGETDEATLVRRLEELAGDGTQLRVITARQRDWFDFVASQGFACVQGPEHPWWGGVVEAAGRQVGVLCLNSAWTSSGDGEYGKLLLGRPQVEGSWARPATRTCGWCWCTIR